MTDLSDDSGGCYGGGGPACCPTVPEREGMRGALLPTSYPAASSLLIRNCWQKSRKATSRKGALSKNVATRASLSNPILGKPSTPFKPHCAG